MAEDDVPVEDALLDLDETFLLCRDVHHAWTVDRYSAASRGGVERVLLCERCGTERVDEWTLSGMRVTAHYHYADGYQLNTSRARPIGPRSTRGPQTGGSHE